MCERHVIYANDAWLPLPVVHIDTGPLDDLSPLLQRAVANLRKPALAGCVREISAGLVSIGIHFSLYPFVDISSDQL